ncbi:MAG TPA: TlpA disulfide reductase family protein [Blastocatellia bacterium]|nr:TlpA disulfide reductase family protein [Blastocatellia bacterium]
MFRKITIKQVLTIATLLILSIAVIAQAPSVSLRTVDGGSFNLADSRGKVVVLSFGATWVPLSGKELPALQKLADRYAGRNVDFYWVSTNSLKTGTRTYAADADLKAFAAKNGLKMTVLRDPDQAAYRALGVDALPTLVIIDGAGKVQHKHTGFDTDQPDGYAEDSQILDKLVK